VMTTVLDATARPCYREVKRTAAILRAKKWEGHLCPSFSLC
jgi:hypothetical protein